MEYTPEHAPRPIPSWARSIVAPVAAVFFAAGCSLLPASESSNPLGSEELADASTTAPDQLIPLQDLPPLGLEAPTVYVPTWLSDPEYAHMSEVLKGEQVQLTIAFGLPTADGGVESPELPDAMVTLLDEHLGNIKVAVGGWGGETDAEHEAMTQNWDAAMRNPDQFAQEATVFADGYNADMIDIDAEFTEEEATPERKLGLRALMRALRARNPGRKISMAVPAFDLPGGFFAPEPGEDQADLYEIMAYDGAGEWSELADYATDGNTTIAAVDEWAKHVDPANISVGFTTHATQFIGAHQKGDPFTEVLDPTYNTIDPSTIVYDNESLASWANPLEGWTSVSDPRAHYNTLEKLRQKYEGLDQVFVWDGSGLNLEYFSVLD